MSVRPLSIFLTLQEGALIIEALAEYPFKMVFELIGKLNQQANTYANDSSAGQGGDTRAQQYEFSTQELALAIKALGELPFNRVNTLLTNLNEQIAQTKPRHTKKAVRVHGDT